MYVVVDWIEGNVGNLSFWWLGRNTSTRSAKPQEISPGKLRRSGTYNPIRVDIPTTRHLVHGGRVCGSRENDLGNLLPRIFFRKTKTLSPTVGALSTMPVKKSVLRLLNPVMSAQEKYLSSQRGNVELVHAVIEGGAFSNANHLRTLSEERRDGKKYWDAAYETKLKGLFRNLKGIDKRLILRVKCIGYWPSVRGTIVSGTVLSATEFRYFLCVHYKVSTLNLQSHFGGCGTAFIVTHALICSIGGLVIAHHNVIRDELLYLSQRVFTSASVRAEPLIH